MQCRYAQPLDVGTYCRSRLRNFRGTFPIVKSCDDCPVIDKLCNKPREEIDNSKTFAELIATPSKPTQRRIKECIHKGEKTGKRYCPSCCGGKTRIFLFECKLLGGECSIARDVGEKVCEACLHYEPREAA